MQFIVFNIQWMSFNIFLACIPVVFAFLFVHEKNKFFKLLYCAIWLLFLPNTLYLITDITHMIDDWYKVELPYKGIFIFQYVVLILIGIFTLIYSIYPIENMLQKKKGKSSNLRNELILYVLNFLVGFGIVLGRVERLNSWELITDIAKFASISLQTLTSINLLLLAIFFGLFSNIVYFFLKDLIIKNLQTKNR